MPGADEAAETAHHTQLEEILQQRADARNGLLRRFEDEVHSLLGSEDCSKVCTRSLS